MLRMIRNGLSGLTLHLKERDAVRRLQRLDDRMLAEMGIPRSQIRSAVRHHPSRNIP